MQETQVQTEEQRLRDYALKDAAKQKGENAARFATDILASAVVNASPGVATYGSFAFKTEQERDWFKSVMLAQFQIITQRWLEDFCETS